MNPLFKELGGKMPQNNPLNIMQQFNRFKQEMKGKNPTEEINKLLQSGAISQKQLDQAQQMAQQMKVFFNGFK